MSAIRPLWTSPGTSGSRCYMNEENPQHGRSQVMPGSHNERDHRFARLLRSSLFVELLFSAASFYGIIGGGAMLLSLLIARIQGVPVEISGEWLVGLSLTCLIPLYLLRKYIRRLIDEIEDPPTATGSSVR